MDESSPVRVVDTGQSPFAPALSAAPAVIAGIIITIVLTFLFLLHGDELLRKFVTLAPHLRAKRDLVEATRHAQSELSMYVITVTLINAGLGLATALALAPRRARPAALGRHRGDPQLRAVHRPDGDRGGAARRRLRRVRRRPRWRSRHRPRSSACICSKGSC